MPGYMNTNEKNTKEKLKDAAEKEFLEKGYEKASIRSISSRAGMTTGAVYFFFKDKNALFASLVEETFDTVYNRMNEFFENEKKDAEKASTNAFNKENSENIKAALELLEYAYDNFEACELLITQAKGSEYEDSINRIIKIIQQHYRMIANRFSCDHLAKPIDDNMLNWFAHMQVYAFTQLIEKKVPIKEAKKQAVNRIDFMQVGWEKMMEIPDN